MPKPKPTSPPRDKQSRQFTEHMQQVGSFLDDLDRLLVKARRHDAKNAFIRDLQNKLEVTRGKWQEQRFQIAVLALVKSGKSTLINSWLGDEYLPAANTPETTCIVRVQHTKKTQGLLREGEQTLARGAVATNDYLRSLNKRRRESDEHPEGDELLLETPLISLEGRSPGTQRFEILDTPGPNEAGTAALRRKVERVLNDADVIVYVLDYTKLKTLEEQALFVLLKEMRPELLRRCSERLFFVVNKIDLKNRNGLSPSETSAYVTELLKKQLPEMSITPDRIIPVTAERALLARIVERGVPSDKALADFRDIVFGIAGEDKTLEDCRPHALDLLKRSMVPQLEEQVLSFIYRNSGRLMLQGFLDDLSRFLGLLENQLRTAKGALKKDHAELVEKKKVLEKDLEKVRVGLQDVANLTRQFEADTETWVRSQFVRFKRNAQFIIDSAFTQGPGGNASLPARVRRGLERLWNLMSGQSHDEPSARQVLVQVNHQLVSLIEGEFADFQQGLETTAYDKQKELFERLQKHIAPLASRIEKEVGKALNISLISVPLRLPRPSLDAFQQEIQTRIDTLVRRTQHYHEEVRQEQYLKKRGGFCSKDEYAWRDVVVQLPYTQHELAKHELQHLWRQQLDELAATSIKTARAVVREMIENSVHQARLELEDYAASFLETITKELQVSEQGTARRQARLLELDALLNGVGVLSSQVDTCVKELEATSGTAKADPSGREVFISYDSRERKEVQRIIGKLEKRGLSTWVDFRDLRPGLPWLPALEKHIQESGAIALFIGRSGLSFWQNEEMQAAFHEARKRGCPIIPVLLTSYERSELPPLLASRHRVDFRQKKPDPVEQMVFGIRGSRPASDD